MALVTIVYATDETGMGPDVERMGTVEDMPDDLARMWINSGAGREPTEDEVATYNEQHTAEVEAEREDLSKLLKADLEKRAADLGVELPEKATKADIVAAIQDHQAQTADAATEPGSVAQPMVVTTMTGAGGQTSTQAGSPTAADVHTGMPDGATP